MKFNKELAIRVRDSIRAEPEKHRQNSYGTTDPDCGTTMCIGGWAIVLSGNIAYEWEDWGEGYRELDVSDPDSNMFDSASEALGLSQDAANDLFFCWNKEEALGKLEKLIEAN